MLLNYGQMFLILPFGNATAVGTMTGAQVMDLLHQAGTLFKGAIQPSGIRYKFYRYSDALPGPQPYAWGAFDAEVWDKASSSWKPLDLAKTYKVGTNEFLAPAGQDGFTPFKYMKDISYWGDMLNAVDAYVAAHYGTPATAYKGPNGDGTLDGRITRNGDGNDTYESRRGRPGDDLAPQRLPRPPAQDRVGGEHFPRPDPTGHDRQAGACTQPDPHPPVLPGRQHPGRLDDVLLQERRPGHHGRRHAVATLAMAEPIRCGHERHVLQRHGARQPRVQLRRGGV